MTRTYRLGKREATQAATRARIVDAALELFKTKGMSGTSMLAVATAADVAPGTVRHHFPDKVALAEAVGERVLTVVRVPEPSIFAGIVSTRERIERLSAELAGFSDRGDMWWTVMQREPELAAAWAGLATAYDVRLEALIRAALGSLGQDDEAVAVVAAVIGPPTFYALRGRGFTAAAAARIGIELVVPWLEAREPR